METLDAKILAMYLGCDVQIALTEFRIGKLTGVYTKAIPAENVNRVQVYHDKQINWFDTSDIKLLLRPLSSMTEEEKLKLYQFGFTCNRNGLQIKEPKEWHVFKPAQFAWLLSKSFDLFGLIEKGIAIESRQ